ncbi:MAG: hypothetical protein ACRDH2_16175, partial [Anaerolineales bacterium]
AGSAAAVDIRGGDTVTIGQDEVIDDDLILGGENVVMDGTVNGDLIVGGANVVINGTVNGSLVMGGQSVTLNGRVAGSVYSSGASITFGPNASVGRNTFVAGYSFEMESGSAVARDALVAGYQGILAGEVGRDLRADVGALELNGVVGGDVQANVGEPEPGAPQFMPFFMPGMPTPIEPGLRVGPEAEIGGQLIYTSAIEQSSNIATQPGGGVVFQTPQPGEQPQAGPSPQVSVGINILNWFVARGRELITLLIFGALVLWQAPAQLNTIIEKARTQALPAAGWGLVVIIVGYAGAFIVAGLIVALGILFGIVTLGGLSGTVLGVGLSGLGLVFTVFTFLVSYGSKLVVAYLVSKLLMQRLAPQYAENKVGLLALGVVLYVIIRGIPLFGWLIGVIVTLVGVGAMWLAFREWRARPMVSAMLAPAT